MVDGQQPPLCNAMPQQIPTLNQQLLHPPYTPSSTAPLNSLLPSFIYDCSIMRPQLFRAAARSLRVPRARPFATTAPRAAEVELTIGMSLTL